MEISRYLYVFGGYVWFDETLKVVKTDYPHTFEVGRKVGNDYMDISPEAFKRNFKLEPEPKKM